MVITGCAGFVGNAACARYRDKYHVIGVDDMSRPTAKVPEGVVFFGIGCHGMPLPTNGSIDIVLHLVAQVSVVESIKDPGNDFERNAQLTSALGLWASKCGVKKFIYSSTNKVYGDLTGVTSPILDSQPIAPTTPYGISKACGGLYVREFLPDVGYDFRQSCIVGEGQTGTFDQGWVGFLIRQVRDSWDITCYGDGTQTRDLLHVEDLLDAYDLAIEGKLQPGSYCIGGGPTNVFQFEQVVNLLGGRVHFYKDWRPHDQRYFVSANEGLRAVGWKPKISAQEWLMDQKGTIRAT
jgi:CDP-paratose 2-epimerase